MDQSTDSESLFWKNFGWDTTMILRSAAVALMLTFTLGSCSESTSSATRNDDKPVVRQTPVIEDGHERQSPEEAVTKLVSAAQQGDLAGYRGTLCGLSLAKLEYAIADHSFLSSYASRFGSPQPFAKSVMSVEDDVMRRFANTTFRVLETKPIGKNRALLTVKTSAVRSHEETWLAIKTGDEWQLELPGLGFMDEVTRKRPEGKPMQVRVLRYERLTDDRSKEIQVFEQRARFYADLADRIRSGDLAEFWQVLKVVESFKRKEEARE